jgi:putative DNA primase/helicase
MTNTVRITVFTSDSAPLCKRFTLKGDTIVKDTLAQLYAGKAETAPAATAAELNATLDQLDHRQAIATGVLKTGRASLITTAARISSGAAARSLKYFTFSKGQGWLLWDYDDKTMPADVQARVASLGGPFAALLHIWPEAKDAAHVIRPSSSDGITAPNQAELKSAGLHGFFLVQDVAQSRAILDTLQARAWEAGLAWITLSKSGGLLERSIVDTAVGSPERLIFEAPPILDAPVIRLPRPAIVSEGVALACPASPLERAAQTRDAARDAIKPKAAKAQTAYIDDRATVAAEKTGKSWTEARRAIVQMMQGATLADDHLLQMKGGEWVSVAALLDAGKMHDRLSMPDPIEGIEYGRDKATLMTKPRANYPDEKPRLISHAHGVTTVYKFARYEPAPSPERVTLPAATELPNGRKVDMLAMLQESTAENALPLAVAVAHKLQNRAPLIYTPRNVVQIITDNLPADTLTAPQIDALKARVEWLQWKRRTDMMLRTQIAPDSFAAHDVRRIKSLAEIDVTGWRGVMAIKAPMAAGKTQLAGRPFVQDAQANGKSIMAIAHRTTLIGELSQRLGLLDYRDLAQNELAEKQGCAVCLPSTTRGDIAEAMPAPECLFIDEIAQVLQFLAEDICRSGMKNNRGVYERLLQLVRDAKAVIVADADLDARTIAFLEKARPNERFTIVEVAAKPTGKTALVTGDTGKVLDTIAIEIEAGGKVWLACEGKAKARAFTGHFEALGYKVLCITADTKLDPAPRDFLKNPEAASREYDLVISSPAISSGLSIEHKGQPHFTLGAYIGAGTATRPEDAKQQLGRVRYLTRFVIGLDYSNLSGGQTVAGYREGIEGAAQIEKLALSWTDFDTYCTDIKAEAENAKADFAAGLWWLLEAAGWTLERPENPEGQAGRKLVKDVTAAAKKQRCAAILAAPIVDSHQAGLLENMARDSEQETRRTAHKIRTGLGKLDLITADVAFWNEGQGRGTIERFEDLIGAEVNLAPESDVLSANRFRIARRRLFSILFNGINLNGTITQADAETILDRLMERPAVFVAAGIVGIKYRAQFRGKGGKLTPVKRPKQAGREITEILKRCGLILTRKKAHSAPKPSSIDTKGESFGAITKSVTSWTVKPESMVYMAAILARRDGFEIDEAIARADRSYIATQPAKADPLAWLDYNFPDYIAPPYCPWPRDMVIATEPPRRAGAVP